MKEENKSKKVLLLVETSESLVDFLKKKISEPRGMVFSQLDGSNTIIYNVIENITDDCVIVDLKKSVCSYSSVIGGTTRCFVDKYPQASLYPICDHTSCPKRIFNKLSRLL